MSLKQKQTWMKFFGVTGQTATGETNTEFAGQFAQALKNVKSSH